MFDFAWSEILLIGVVALIAIGPKDMPAALKAVAGVIKKARRMAAEFQTHLDELMREADLHEVREQINEIRNFDVRHEFEQTVDPDGSLRQTFASNPLEPTPKPAGEPPATADSPAESTTADLPKTYVLERPADTVATDTVLAEAHTAPDFVPPPMAASAATPKPVLEEAEEPPAFVPPGTHRS